MNEIPNWFEQGYTALTTQKTGEAMILEKKFPTIEILWGEFNGKMRGVFLPNPLEYEGRPIGEDPKTPVAPWVANFLGNFAARFSLLPERANGALERNIENRRKELEGGEADEEWLLRSTMVNFGLHFDPQYIRSLDEACEGKFMETRLPLKQALLAWPSLELRTMGDVHRHFHETLSELDLTAEFERLKGQNYDRLKGENLNIAAYRPLFPVMIGMLEKGVPFYPTLIA